MVEQLLASLDGKGHLVHMENHVKTMGKPRIVWGKSCGKGGLKDFLHHGIEWESLDADKRCIQKRPSRLGYLQDLSQ